MHARTHTHTHTHTHTMLTSYMKVVLRNQTHAWFNSFHVILSTHYIYWYHYSQYWLCTKYLKLLNIPAYCGAPTYVYDILNKNSLGLLKKGAPKQSRIKSIAWHLRWLVRTRADISLRPSGLVRPRTDIKLRPSAFVRTRTDFKLQTVGLGRSYKD